MENTIKFFWNGIKVNGKLNKFNFCLNGDHVSFYEDGYDAEMPAECGVAVINNSDGMTDYFEKDHGNVYPEHPLYKFFENAARMAQIHHFKMENLSRPEMLAELAFYADMQVLHYANGDALISAEKKEDFLKQFGHGLTVTPNYDELENTKIPYPDWKVTVPPAESLQHVSKTGALFYPGQLGVLDLVADAFEVMLTDASTVTYNLYGSDDKSGHVAIYPGILLMAMPLNFSKEKISVVPSKDDVEEFFKPSQFNQIEMELNTNE